MPAMKLSLALAATVCSLVSGFVARPAPLSQQFAATSLTSAPARSASSGMKMAVATALEKVEKNVFETEGSLAHLFEQNRQWAQAQDPGLFERLRNSQEPKFLYIGCSDSRVTAEAMLKLEPGDLFVHRNVANLCLNHDMSMNSVVKYAVEVLGVTDIIVCGHYGCGGVKASTLNTDHGLLEHWLYAIRNVQRLHKAELDAIPDENQRFRRLVELNVKESCLNLFANPIVQKKQAEAAQPRIHGWVYDVATGLVKDLKINFKDEVKKYKDIYGMYDVESARTNLPAMTPRKPAASPAPAAPAPAAPAPVQQKQQQPQPQVVNGASASTSTESSSQIQHVNGAASSGKLAEAPAQQAVPQQQQQPGPAHVQHTHVHTHHVYIKFVSN